MTGPRVVIVGNGMAGSRAAEEIRALDANRLVDLTVISEERHSAYNRILLSEVLAGRHKRESIALQHQAWHADNGVTLHVGAPVVSIDRPNRLVILSDGVEVPFDVLVLALGSRSWTPPVEGLSADGQMIDRAYAFRTLDDCERIEAAAPAATRAVVLGGGLLGIEAARGLAGRGIPVVVVHMAKHLMERQIDPAAGRVLAKTLDDLGVTVRLGAVAESVITDSSGGFGGLALADGSCVLGDLLVVATGVRAEVAIARDAGLEVGNGVIVDDTMRSVTDPRIFAIGECAEHRGSVYGLVAPGWEQARIAAAQITGSDPSCRYRGSRIVTRLKASGIELASLGNPFADDEDLDVVQVSDPGRGTYAKVLLTEGKVVGAIVLGQIAGIGTLTTLFDRDAELPDDRLSLLMPLDAASEARVARAASPATMPGNALVCKCNAVTKSAIQKCVLAGAQGVQGVAAATRATTGCGGCSDAVAGIVDWLAAAEPDLQEVS